METLASLPRTPQEPAAKMTPELVLEYEHLRDACCANIGAWCVLTIVTILLLLTSYAILFWQPSMRLSDGIILCISAFFTIVTVFQTKIAWHWAGEREAFNDLFPHIAPFWHLTRSPPKRSPIW